MQIQVKLPFLKSFQLFLGTRLCLRNGDKAGCKSILQASDPENDAFEYKIDDDAIRNNFPFNIDPRSGQLTLQSSVDREAKSTWEFDVLATNTDDFENLEVTNHANLLNFYQIINHVIIQK